MIFYPLAVSSFELDFLFKSSSAYCVAVNRLFKGNAFFGMGFKGKNPFLFRVL